MWHQPATIVHIPRETYIRELVFTPASPKTLRYDITGNFGHAIKGIASKLRLGILPKQ
jgi:hypothetical protein